MISPPIILGLAFLRCLPRPFRQRISTFLGIDAANDDAAGSLHSRTSIDFSPEDTLATKADPEDLDQASASGVSIEMGDVTTVPLPAVIASMDATPDLEAAELAHRQEALLAQPDSEGWNFNPLTEHLRRTNTISLVTMDIQTATDRIRELEHQLALAALNQEAVEQLSEAPAP